MKKLFAGIFLTFGFVVTMTIVAGLLGVVPSPPEGKDDLAFAGIIFGLPPIVIGLLLVKSIQKQKEHSQQDISSEIESVFLQRIQANQGVVDPISFAIATKLSIEEAKKYLELKSKQLNGTFDVNERGGISYIFNI